MKAPVGQRTSDGLGVVDLGSHCFEGHCAVCFVKAFYRYVWRMSQDGKNARDVALCDQHAKERKGL